MIGFTVRHTKEITDRRRPLCGVVSSFGGSGDLDFDQILGNRRRLRSTITWRPLKAMYNCLFIEQESPPARCVVLRQRMQEDLISALNEIDDPELEIGIVDLGLVY